MLKVLIFASCMSFNYFAFGQDSTFMQAQQSFALELYANVSGPEYLINSVLSPISVDISLSVLLVGSSGFTFKQLLNGLKYPANYSINFVQSNSNLLIKNMQKVGGLEFVTRLYLSTKYSLQNIYKSAIQKYFNSSISLMDFSDPTSVKTINDFVTASTHGMIQNMLDEGDISPKTALVLVNCIYFKGTWVYQFDKSKISQGNFRINKTNSITVDYMYMTAPVNMGTVDALKATVIELPYVNTNLTLTIVLPLSGYSLKNLMKAARSYDWRKVSNMLYNQSVEVTIPKFNATLKQYLNNPLINMGMDSLFNASATQFDHIAHDYGTSVKITLDYVLHEAVINVDEEGTTAAAATVSSARSLPPSFSATRPFLYFLKTSSTIYFIGQFTGQS
ncbi:hypothetical protein PVAND_017021 [Polypedilum vanderplanki]|uniref:Serpin domain-containing protein n=1 Tax=Polypedilum vanderplanki TaxID=319348 RepID=A0A9J6BH33_POLVA|nr:hypothetical protein PVAND_017021 [Polypedilum vanderplanki]